MAIDSLADKDIIDTELQLKDLETIEAQLAKTEKVASTGNKDAKVLLEVLKSYKEVLDKGQNARSVTFESKEEQKAAHDLFLLTTKPVLYVCNVDEGSAATGNAFSARVAEMAKAQGAGAVVISAAIEAEIVTMEPADRPEYLEALGLAETGLARIIRAGYELLGLLTYFTAGPKEVRAWTVVKGSTAPQAAGVIHTDFEKGFIRAQTIAFDDFIRLGGEQGAKEAGRMRSEGKEYIVQDGDVMNFLFNV